ncbi:MAG: hypothetical protein V8S76_01230 [Lachnospiraceae bacterium]
MEKLLTLDGFHAVNAELKKYIDNLVKESVAECVVQEDSFLRFPTIGSEKTIYIDTTTNKVYRWEDESLKYYVVGSDYEEIEVIDGSI